MMNAKGSEQQVYLVWDSSFRPRHAGGYLHVRRSAVPLCHRGPQELAAAVQQDQSGLCRKGDVRSPIRRQRSVNRHAHHAPGIREPTMKTAQKQKKPRPAKGWALVFPNGRIDVCTVTDSRLDIMPTLMDGEQGAKVRRVIISVIE